MKKWMLAALIAATVLCTASACTAQKTQTTLEPSAPHSLESTPESVHTEGSASLTPSSPQPIVVEQISCSHERISLVEGQTVQVTFEVLPATAENKELVFSVEPAQVASYENGVLTAQKAGTAVLKVSSADEGGAVLEIPVEVAAYIPVTELKPDITELTLSVGESSTILCTVLPENATEPEITWQVEDSDVARFEKGVLTALKVGSTTLTVKSVSAQVSVSLPITVVPHENHRMGEWEVVFPASCTEVGMQIRYCEICHTDYYEYEAIELRTHEYGEAVTVREATRAQNGLREKTCALCQGKEEIVFRLEDGELAYGKLGDEIEYSFYSDGELYIRGEGQMYQWDSQKVSPIRSLQGVKKVFFSGSVELITDTTFEGLTELEQVALAEGLKMIGNRAFYGCTSLQGVAFPATLQFVGGAAFAECKKITAAEFSSALVGLGQSAFEGCTALKTVVIGENVTSIGSRAFAECVSLTDSIFQCTKLTTILSETFLNCSSLKKLVLPACVKTVERSAFSGCTSLLEANLSGCIGVEEEGFSGCTALQSVSFGKELSWIREDAFSECTALMTVRYNESEAYFSAHVSVASGNETLGGKWVFNG